MPEGSIFLTFAESCGLPLIFSEIGLLVVAVLWVVLLPLPVVVSVPVSVPVVVVPVPPPVVSVGAVDAFFGLPLVGAFVVSVALPCVFAGFVVERGPPRVA